MATARKARHGATGAAAGRIARLAILLVTLQPWPGRAQDLIADLSHHLVAITTAFAGSDVLLFGTVGVAGRDVVVTVRGPSSDWTVRRKTRVGFMWLNTQHVTFANVPAFLSVAANAPLTDIADASELERQEIGAERLKLEAIAIEGVGNKQVPVFKEGLIRRKQREGLYAAKLGRVQFIGAALFRTTLHFPANVPPGDYQIRVFELEKGTIVAAQTNALVVSKVGLEADLFDVAHQRSWLYGGVGILLALGAGWGAAVIFKRS